MIQKVAIQLYNKSYKIYYASSMFNAFSNLLCSGKLVYACLHQSQLLLPDIGHLSGKYHAWPTTMESS